MKTTATPLLACISLALGLAALLMAAGSLFAQDVPIYPIADQESFGIDSVNTSPGLVNGETGTIHDQVASNWRYQAARGLGASWTRWVLWWHDVERYNLYTPADEGDAINEASCNDTSMDAIPPSEVQWTWNSNDSVPENDRIRYYDELVAADAAQGLNTLIVLQGVPRCRQITPNTIVAPRNLDEPIFLDESGFPSHDIDWSTARSLDSEPADSRINPENRFAYFVFKAVERYGDRVRYWQVWNEPNQILPSGSRVWPQSQPKFPDSERAFARLLEVAYHAGKYANSEIQLVLAGFSDVVDDATNGRPGIEPFLAALNRPSDRYRAYYYRDYPGVFALHSYSGPWAMVNFVHWFTEIKGFKERPIWFTETGVNEPVEKISEENRASYVLQLLGYLLARSDRYNIERYFHFALDNATDDTGLLGCVGTNCASEGTEREMFVAYQLAERYLKNAEPLDIGSDNTAMMSIPDPLSRSDRSAGLDQAIYLSSPEWDRITLLWATSTWPRVVEVDPMSTTSSAFVVFQDQDPHMPPIEIDRFPNGKYQIFLPGVVPGPEGGVHPPMGGKTKMILECDANCPRLDLAFVIDTTGSMWDDIANVKTATTEIVDAIATVAEDFRVAVVEFKDFNVWPYGWSSDYPYRAVQGFSNDPDLIQNAIHNLQARGGANWPESVHSGILRTIRSENLGGWRPNAIKAIVLLGDAPPHNADVFNRPEPRTGYTLSQILAEAEAGGVLVQRNLSQRAWPMKEAGVAPIKIFSILIGNDSAARAAFKDLAEGSGGQLFTAASAGDVVAAILDVLGELPPTGNRPPVCDFAVPSETQLWPPNHKMQPVDILNVTDPDEDPVTLTITGITQDEPVRDRGSGKTWPDGAGIGANTASLRAERSGSREGRVYEVSFTAEDDRGASCAGSVQVCVPHDRGANVVCVDDGQLYDSTQP